MNKIHYTFIACDELDVSGNYRHAVEIVFTMYAFDEEAAMKHAKSMLKRNLYFLRKVQTCS